MPKTATEPEAANCTVSPWPRVGGAVFDYYAVNQRPTIRQWSKRGEPQLPVLLTTASRPRSYGAQGVPTIQSRISAVPRSVLMPSPQSPEL
jgi:hypothetical protein